MAAIPTIDDVLADTAIGGGFHQFGVSAGAVVLTTAQLRAALEEAYDPTDPDWVLWVDEDRFMDDNND